MMNKKEDFFERCIGIVAGLEVENEAQAIAKEVVLDEVENLQQRIDKVNQIIDELLLMGTNEYEIEEQLECLKRVLAGKE